MRRVLFFPTADSRKLTGEERRLPARHDLEDDVWLLIEELILGPAAPDLDRILPRKAHIEGVMFRDGTLYLNLSKDMILTDESTQYGLDDMILAVGNAVLFNFPRIKQLFIFVDGQQPGSEYEQGLELSLEQLN